MPTRARKAEIKEGDKPTIVEIPDENWDELQKILRIEKNTSKLWNN